MVGGCIRKTNIVQNGQWGAIVPIRIGVIGRTPVCVCVCVCVHVWVGGWMQGSSNKIR